MPRLPHVPRLTLAAVGGRTRIAAQKALGVLMAGFMVAGLEAAAASPADTAIVASLVGPQSPAAIQDADQLTTNALPTLASIEASGRSQDYTAVQLRRFRDDTGGVVTVRERLEVDAGGVAEPTFTLTFLGVEGEPAGSPLQAEWQQIYQRYGRLFFRHGSFRVHDLARAASNYALHDFGPVVRAGRSARRMVVFPNSSDKACWIVDVDLATHVPLFVAEFDARLNLFAEIEVLTFSTQVTPLPALVSTGTTVLPDFATAEALLGHPAGLIDPNIGIVPDYGLERIELRDDPLNGQQELVMVYTDGLDQFMVVQTPGVADPFASLPRSGTAHTLARFRDPALRALFFWDGGIAVHVAGRGSLQRLDEVAKRLYLQALATN